MVDRKGRTSSRVSETEQSLEKPETCTESFLEHCWLAARARDPIVDQYDDPPTSSIKLDTVAEALRYLAKLDPAFQDALLVLKAYQLDRGGLRQTIRRQMKRFELRPGLAIALPRMAAWLLKLGSVNRAAKFTAAQLGVPGHTFSEVVSDLRKAYPEYQKAVASRDAAAVDTAGDTGRKLRVRMARPWLDSENQPMRQIRGVTFAADGTGEAPDDRWWRVKVREGLFELIQTLPAQTLGKTSE